MSPTQARGTFIDLGTFPVDFHHHYDFDVILVNRDGLYIYNDFRTEVAVSAKPVGPGVGYHISALEITENMNDTKIEVELSATHNSYVFNETQVCATIVGLVFSQFNREEGILQTNGRPNILYTQFCIAYAVWNEAMNGWIVGKCSRLDRKWFSGARVFSLLSDK